MKHGKILLPAVLLVLVLAGAGVLYQQLGSSEKTETESLSMDEESDRAEDTDDTDDTDDTYTPPLAADFSFTDTDGNPVRLADYIGEPIVLNFWASWCSPCTSELPGFENAWNTYGDRVQFLMVNVTDGYQETVDTASSFVEEEGYLFPLYFDTTGEGVNAYGIYSIPQTFLIDSEGYIQTQYVGAATEEKLVKSIEKLLAAEE